MSKLINRMLTAMATSGYNECRDEFIIAVDTGDSFVYVCLGTNMDWQVGKFMKPTAFNKGEYVANCLHEGTIHECLQFVSTNYKDDLVHALMIEQAD